MGSACCVTTTKKMKKLDGSSVNLLSSGHVDMRLESSSGFSLRAKFADSSGKFFEVDACPPTDLYDCGLNQPHQWTIRNMQDMIDVYHQKLLEIVHEVETEIEKIQISFEAITENERNS